MDNEYYDKIDAYENKELGIKKNSRPRKREDSGLKEIKLVDILGDAVEEVKESKEKNENLEKKEASNE